MYRQTAVSRVSLEKDMWAHVPVRYRGGQQRGVQDPKKRKIEQKQYMFFKEACRIAGLLFLWYAVSRLEGTGGRGRSRLRRLLVYGWEMSGKTSSKVG